MKTRHFVIVALVLMLLLVACAGKSFTAADQTQYSLKCYQCGVLIFDAVVVRAGDLTHCYYDNAETGLCIKQYPDDGCIVMELPSDR